MPKINYDADRSFQSLARQAASRPKKKKRRLTEAFEDPDYVSLEMDPDFVREEEEEDEDDAFLFVRDLSRPGGGLARMSDSYLKLPGVAGNNASTPDSEANSITGDIDIRIKVRLLDWMPANEPVLMSKNDGASSQAWLLQVSSTGGLYFRWNANGADVAGTVNQALNLTPGTLKWLRVTLDVDDGAGGWIARSYMSDDYNPDDGSGQWVQVGADVTGSPATSIFDSTAAVTVGGVSWAAGAFTKGELYYAEIRNGIGGDVVLRFDADDAADAATSFTAQGTGETWTVNQSGAPAARIVRV